MTDLPPDKSNPFGRNVTIDFGERFASSDLFNRVFREGMSLVEETAAYLDGAGRRDARDLPRPVSICYATESMRLTTRLMQMASWLLLQRAVKDGEMSVAEASEDRYHIDLDSLHPGPKLEVEGELPDGLQDLINRSLRLLDRIKKLNQMLSGETTKAAPEKNPLTDQMSKLEAAFQTNPGSKKR